MKRTKKSLRKIKLLLLLIILTTVLAITATYAWFSSQRDVEITGMKINVEVAENMQISLDGEHWLQSIAIDNMRQFYGTYSDTSTHQAKLNENTNYVPTELKPVSTIGEVVNGKLQFMTGEAVIGEASTSITATPCSEDDLLANATVDVRQTGNASHPYLVFDMYLRNLSKKTSDKLVLNIGSRLWVDEGTVASQEGRGVEGTGLENCTRVAFVPYGNKAEVTANGETIRVLTYDGNETAAIWEPNDLEHTADVVNNSKRGVQDGTTMPTYGIKYSGTAVTVNDVESTTDTKLAEQVTMKPVYSTTSGTIAKTNITDTAGTSVELEGNKVTKVRVYIWLEGQDVDCLNSASYGDRLQATIKLTKPQNDDGTENTYTGESSGSGGSGSGDTNVITAATLAVEDYGGYVTNYTPTNGVNSSGTQWRIFHSDGSNIYLIADDYVESTYVPNGKGGSEIYVNSTTYRVSFNNIINDYAGYSDIASNLATKLLSKYVAAGYTSTNNNMKAIAYLMDTNVWSSFKDSSGYAEYSIGGPTLELFTASYNTTHTSKTIDTQVSSRTGYQVKWSTDSSYANYISGLDTLESLYVISSNTNVYAMWLASPSAYTTDYLMGVNYYGGVIGDYYTYYGGNPGARPLVSLRSSVQLEKQEDGTYKIIQ